MLVEIESRCIRPSVEMDRVHHGNNTVAICKLGNCHNSGGQKVSAMKLGSDEESELYSAGLEWAGMVVNIPKWCYILN